jgi:hypothetical protein
MVWTKTIPLIPKILLNSAGMITPSFVILNAQTYLLSLPAFYQFTCVVEIFLILSSNPIINPGNPQDRTSMLPYLDLSVANDYAGLRSSF